MYALLLSESWLWMAARTFPSVIQTFSNISRNRPCLLLTLQRETFHLRPRKACFYCAPCSSPIPAGLITASNDCSCIRWRLCSWKVLEYLVNIKQRSFCAATSVQRLVTRLHTGKKSKFSASCACCIVCPSEDTLQLHCWQNTYTAVYVRRKHCGITNGFTLFWGHTSGSSIMSNTLKLYQRM